MNRRRAAMDEEKKLLVKQEDHFLDFKSKLITPSKLQESFVAFANTDGGELYIGIEDEKFNGERINGFIKIEDANDILETLLEQTNPAVENLDIEFIDFDSKSFLIDKLYYEENKPTAQYYPYISFTFERETE